MEILPVINSYMASGTLGLKASLSMRRLIKAEAIDEQRRHHMQAGRAFGAQQA